MTDKEKLMQILNVPIFPRTDADPLEAVADYLLDNDVRPVRHAHWEEENPLYSYDNKINTCTNCRRSVIGKFQYCPMCGAKMDEETNG